MHGTYLIEVAHKAGIKDPLAEGLTEDLRHMGARSIQKVSTSKLYRVIGQLNPDERTKVCKELLSDPVVEDVYEGGWDPDKSAPSRKAGKPKSIVVDVWYKQGVTDAVGESVLKGLHDMEFTDIQDVRTGMRYRFTGLKDAKSAEKLALALLINPLIHDRTIHVD